MSNENQAIRMVFDVESIGLHGEGWAVGYVVLSGGRVDTRHWAWCHPSSARGTKEGQEWVAGFCPWAKDGPGCAALPPGRRMGTPRELRDWFWSAWLDKRCTGAELWADVPWPVEARFLIACVEDARVSPLGRGALPKTTRELEGPYPLFDVHSYASRFSLQRPAPILAHHPLSDALQSAELILLADEAAKTRQHTTKGVSSPILLTPTKGTT